MTIKDKLLREIDTDAFINEDLIERVDVIVDESCLDDSYKIGSVDEQEERHISELWRISENMDKTELATLVARAVRKYPLMVLHVLGEYIIEILKEGEKR
jgi:hypothetical protein